MEVEQAGERGEMRVEEAQVQPEAFPTQMCVLLRSAGGLTESISASQAVSGDAEPVVVATGPREVTKKPRHKRLWVHSKRAADPPFPLCVSEASRGWQPNITCSTDTLSRCTFAQAPLPTSVGSYWGITRQFGVANKEKNQSPLFFMAGPMLWTSMLGIMCVSC